MADRAVMATRKDIDGDIVAVGSTGERWSPRAKHDVIVDIQLGLHTYYVPWPTGRTEIRVVHGPAGKYLRTELDSRDRNGLLDLADL